jgi:hypothetical protein
MTSELLANVTCVAIEGRGLLIEGKPGSGKSTLALALIDRGAALVGDDGIAIEDRGGRLWAYPPPKIAGKLEIRGVGIASLPTVTAPLCLSIALGALGERLPGVGSREILTSTLPALDFPESVAALRVEWAMRLHGLPLPAPLA